MGAPLPDLPEPEFRRELAHHSPYPLSADSLTALYQHFQLLRQWNPSLNLIGPGTVRQCLERHYLDSLSGLRLLREEDRRLLDLGSGAGFPGWVLAAARQSLEVTLVEAKGRKWAFLQTAVRRAGLSCRCLNARVFPPFDPTLLADLDVITSRAVRWKEEEMANLFRTAPKVRLLLWHGPDEPRVPRNAEVARRLEHGPRQVLEICGKVESTTE